MSLRLYLTVLVACGSFSFNKCYVQSSSLFRVSWSLFSLSRLPAAPQYQCTTVVKVVMWSRGGGLTWRTRHCRRWHGEGRQLVGAISKPIPHDPTKLALFGHNIALYSIYNTYNAQQFSRRRYRHFSSLLTFNSPFLILMLLHALVYWYRPWIGCRVMAP